VYFNAKKLKINLHGWFYRYFHARPSVNQFLGLNWHCPVS